MLRRFDTAIFRLDSRSRSVLGIAIPAGLNSLLDILATAVDLLMVGFLSIEATVAVGVGLNYFMLIYVFSTVFFVGTNALVSRAFGARDEMGANDSFSTILVTALVACVPIFILARFTYEGFFDLIGTSAEAKALGIQYVGILTFIVPFFFARIVMVAALSACGDTKTPFLIKLFSAFLNVVLNYIFIFGAFGFPVLGVAGAALSTLLVAIVEVGILGFLLFTSRRAVAWSGRIIPGYAKRALKVGLPSGIERCLTIVSLLVVMKLVATYGMPELAGYQIGTRIEGFVFMPGFGFAVAAMTLMGQNIGAGKLDEAEKHVHATLWLGGAFMGSLGLFMIFMPHFFSSFFSSDDQTIAASALYIFAFGFSQIPLSMVFIFDGALRGAGATKATLAVNTLSIWGLRIVPAWFLASHGYPLWLIYVLISAETFVRAWMFWLLFKRGIWRSVVV